MDEVRACMFLTPPLSRSPSKQFQNGDEMRNDKVRENIFKGNEGGGSKTVSRLRVPHSCYAGDLSVTFGLI